MSILLGKWIQFSPIHSSGAPKTNANNYLPPLFDQGHCPNKPQHARLLLGAFTFPGFSPLPWVLKIIRILYKYCIKAGLPWTDRVSNTLCTTHKTEQHSGRAEQPEQMDRQTEASWWLSWHSKYLQHHWFESWPERLLVKASTINYMVRERHLEIKLLRQIHRTHCSVSGKKRSKPKWIFKTTGPLLKTEFHSPLNNRCLTCYKDFS